MDEIISQIDKIVQTENISESIYDLTNPENIRTYNIIRKNENFKPIIEDMDVDDLNIKDVKNICKIGRAHV